MGKKIMKILIALFLLIPFLIGLGLALYIAWMAAVNGVG